MSVGVAIDQILGAATTNATKRPSALIVAPPLSSSPCTPSELTETSVVSPLGRSFTSVALAVVIAGNQHVSSVLSKTIKRPSKLSGDSRSPLRSSAGRAVTMVSQTGSASAVRRSLDIEIADACDAPLVAVTVKVPEKSKS
ncbi:MAG: hypothetical protein R3D01_04550 [Hyphomicrobiales bacterium]